MADEFPTADPVLLPDWGRVASCTGATRWCVMSADDVPITPIQSYLEDLVARDFSDGTVRSYAYALLRWWRRLRLHGLHAGRVRPKCRPYSSSTNPLPNRKSTERHCLTWLDT